jgi:hypothetical protein
VWPLLHRYQGERVSSFRFYNDTAVLAPVTDFSLIFRFNLIKLIVLPAVYLKTLGAIPLMQVVGVDGQMAVPAPEHIFLFRQQDKGEVPA